MKVILIKDVPKVGNKYDVKEFPQGYAQNVLISKGLAVLATAGELAKLKDKKDQMERRREEENKIFESLISSINNTKIEIKAKANEKGHLFKAVSPVDVAFVIKNITGIDVDTNAVIMEHIKELGNHSIEIKKGDKKGKCEIIVVKA